MFHSHELEEALHMHFKPFAKQQRLRRVAAANDVY